MAEFWEFDYKEGWLGGRDFIEEYLILNNINDIGAAIKDLGYRDGYGIYQIDDSLLGNPIQVYELQRDSTLPKYLIEFCPTGGDINYFGARNMPSLIELLNKLSPLVQATLVGSFVDDINNEKYK